MRKEDIFARYSESVPLIGAFCKPNQCDYPGEYNHGASTGFHGHGSGILVAHDGRLLIVTNRHVVENSGDMQFKATFIEKSGTGGPSPSLHTQFLNASEFKVHPDGVDLACIDVTLMQHDFDRQEIHPAQIDPSEPAQGADLIVIGHPGSSVPGKILWLNITKGLVSNYMQDDDMGWTIVTDATFNPGNSGGPAFDTEGEVIGIATAGTGAKHGLVGGSQNYLVAARELEELMDSGIPYDPATMAPKSERIVLDAANACADLQTWPLTQKERLFLQKVETARKEGGLGWFPYYCFKIPGLSGGKGMPFNISEWFNQQGLQDIDQYLILALASTDEADLDLYTLTTSDKIIDSDVSAEGFACLRGQLKGTTQPARKFRVKNASSKSTDLLILIYR